jgi:HAD superfamily hydrolase (TIGR01490 family)
MSDKFALFDIDGTLIDVQSQQLFLKYLRQKGVIGPGPYLKIMLWFVLYKLGLASEPARIMEYAFSFFKGMTSGELQALSADFFETKLKSHIFPAAKRLIEDHRSSGHDIVLISNSLECLARELGTYLAVKPDHCLATKLELDANGKYTGKMSGGMLYSEHKVVAVRSWWQKNDLTPAETWGYADHLSDLKFLELVDHPTAVNPGRRLSRLAAARNWTILRFKKTA